MNKTKTKTRDMVITALLTALSILIPTAFTFLRVVLPPAFTATLMAHVPVVVAMFISPFSAAFVAIGSAFGFFLTGLPPVVTARAATHIIFAVVGAYMLKKMHGGALAKLIWVGFVTMILHAIMEAAVVIPMMFIVTESPDPAVIYTAAYVTGVGTLIHHAIDYVIAIGVVSALSKAKLIDWRFNSKRK